MESFNKPHFSPDVIEASGEQHLKLEEKIIESVEEIAEKTEPILKKEEIEGIKEYAKKVVQRWHDKFKPDYVFLNETGAVPLGYVLKEAYREAYGDEEIPAFFRVNPAILPTYRRSGGGGIPYGVSPKLAQNPIYLERVEEFFKDRIKKENAKVVIVDEFSPTGQSIRAVRDALHEFGGVDYDRMISENGEGNSIIESVFRGENPRFTTKKIRAKSYAKETAKLNPETVKLRGTINKDDTKKLLGYMHELENVGKEAGLELKKKSEDESLKKGILGNS